MIAERLEEDVRSTQRSSGDIDRDSISQPSANVWSSESSNVQAAETRSIMSEKRRIADRLDEGARSTQRSSGDIDHGAVSQPSANLRSSESSDLRASERKSIVMSEKRMIADRLDRGIRSTQRSSGDIDHDTVSQPPAKSRSSAESNNPRSSEANRIMMSEKRMIADRLDRGIRSTQRSSGDVDYDQGAVAQPTQPRRSVASRAGVSSRNTGEEAESTTFEDELELESGDFFEECPMDVSSLGDSGNDLHGASASDVNLRSSNPGLRASQRTSTTSIKSTASDLSRRKSNAHLRQPPAQSVSTTSIMSDASELSLRKSNAYMRQSSQSSRMTSQSERVSAKTAGRPSNREVSDRSLGFASVPSMVPLRRAQAGAAEDSNALLEPNQRLVKVQPIAGQRQPGAYMAGSQRLSADDDEPHDDYYDETNGDRQEPLAPLEEDPHSDPAMRPEGSVEMSFEGMERPSLFVANSSYGVAGDSVGNDTFDTDQLRSSTTLVGRPQGDKAASRRRRYWIIGGILLLLVVGLGAGLGVAFFGSNSGDKQLDPTSAPTLATTTVAEVACTPDGVFEKCGNANTNIFTAIEIPPCLLGRYEELAQFLGTDAPNRLSCEPENLALLSMALHTTNETAQDILNARYGLSSFFFATGGSNWTRKTDWLTDAAPCNWYGVSCTYPSQEEKDLVSVLELEGNNLNGELVSLNLQLLPGLVYCSLPGNSLTGIVPTDFAKLLVVRLANNRLTGTFPFQEFSESMFTEQLDVSGNTFDSSSFPESFAGTQWNTLILGKLPLERGLFPSQLSTLTNLVVLSLGDMQLAGTLPSSVGSLTNLQRLDLDTNQFSGSLPTELGNLLSLQDGILNFNNFSGPIPSEFGKLTLLEQLDLHQNKLTGTMPTELGNLVNLMEFIFYENAFSGILPDGVCTLKANIPLQLFGSLDIQCVEDYGGLRCPTPECCKC